MAETSGPGLNSQDETNGLDPLDACPAALVQFPDTGRLGDSAVFFLKLSDAPRRINNFLLACIKRVTVRTNLYMEILSKS